MYASPSFDFEQKYLKMYDLCCFLKKRIRANWAAAPCK